MGKLNDDELENVSGGTSRENKILAEELGCFPLYLEERLEKLGILGSFYDEDDNIYWDPVAKKHLTFEEVIELIRKSKKK